MANHNKPEDFHRRDEQTLHVKHSFCDRFFDLLESLLSERKTQTVILKRVEQKVNKMAIDLTKANAGLDALNASFTEIVKEFADLKALINDPASQTAVDAFGDKLTALGQAFKDINPDTPGPAPAGLKRH